MKRSGPPERRTPLPARTTPLRRSEKPLKRTEVQRTAWTPSARSRARTAARRREWERARDAHLAAVGGRCEVCPILIAQGMARHGGIGIRFCAPGEARAVDVHHVLARQMGGSRDHSRLAAACRASHDYIEAHPMMAEALGLKMRHS